MARFTVICCLGERCRGRDVGLGVWVNRMMGIRKRGHVWGSGVVVNYFFNVALAAAEIEEGTR